MARKGMIIILLLGILALIYIPDLYAEEAATDEEITNDEKEAEETPETKSENKQEEEEEENPEVPPLPEKVWESFEIQIADPDGNSGYYITRPDIVIRHMDEQGSTNYILTNGDVEIASGSITEKGGQTIIHANTLKEGMHRLEVSMLDDNGERLEDETGKHWVVKEIRIDTMAPEVEVTTPSGFDVWYQDEVIITTNANDTGSGTDIIRYYIDGLQVKSETLHGGSGSSKFPVILPSESGQKIPVKIEVLDQAGNCTMVYKGVYVDKQDPQIKVTGVSQHEITSQDIELNVHVTDENGISSWCMTGEREEADGTICAIEQSGEEKVNLSAEGIYRMEFQVVDLSGRRSKTNLQVIIDKTDPVIRLIDELNGAYIRAFRLNISKEEMIEEFTSYDLRMSLNGRLYNAQETIYNEGQQLLKVQVIDAAGNEAKTEARFTIDRTKPEIIFTGITDGQEYEGEAEIKIEVANQDDTLEDVRVNGKKMTVELSEFQGVFKDTGEYKVTAVAVDKAGNTTKKSIAFTVKRNEKVWSAASGLFNQVIGKNALGSDGEMKSKQLHSVIVLIAVMAGGTIFVITAVRKLRKDPR